MALRAVTHPLVSGIAGSHCLALQSRAQQGGPTSVAPDFFLGYRPCLTIRSSFRDWVCRSGSHEAANSGRRSWNLAGYVDCHSGCHREFVAVGGVAPDGRLRVDGSTGVCGAGGWDVGGCVP
jgi:hypothetical protein